MGDFLECWVHLYMHHMALSCARRMAGQCISTSMVHGDSLMERIEGNLAKELVTWVLRSGVINPDLFPPMPSVNNSRTFPTNDVLELGDFSWRAKAVLDAADLCLCTSFGLSARSGSYLPKFWEWF